MNISIIKNKRKKRNIRSILEIGVNKEVEVETKRKSKDQNLLMRKEDHLLSSKVKKLMKNNEQKLLL